MRVVAVIPAAGRGRRMASATAKQFLLLEGVPLLVQTLRAFEEHSLVEGIVLAVAGQERQTLEQEILGCFRLEKLLEIVDGGRERQDSVALALRVVPRDCEVVLIHDGVRPLVTAEVITGVIEGARRHGAALAGIPVRDTVKQVQEGQVTSTLDRGTLRLAQTPQGFRADLIRRAHELALGDQVSATDDAVLVERLGIPVRVVPGSEENIKVTTPADLIVAEAILAARKKASGD